MAFSRDQILKAWDEAMASYEDPTDEEIDAAIAAVCAKLPGLTYGDLANALRTSVEEKQRKIVA